MINGKWCLFLYEVKWLMKWPREKLIVTNRGGHASNLLNAILILKINNIFPSLWMSKFSQMSNNPAIHEE